MHEVPTARQALPCKGVSWAKPPSSILSELNRSSSILRDLFDDQFKGVYCNDKNLCYELKDYIQQIAPLPHQVVFFSSFEYQALYLLSDSHKKMELKSIKNQSICLFTAIASTHI